VNDTLAEKEIVRGLRNGDRRAWEALCKQYSPRVWRYVARLVGSDEEAVADVFQETMLAVAKAGRTLTEETDNLWPWLAAIGHNQAALHWRKAYKRGPVCPPIEPREALGNHDPLDNLMRAETVDLVRSLLAEMNSEAVTLLMGKYLDGLSVQELVKLLGGTHEGVRSRLARARRDFRSRYERAINRQVPSERTAIQELSPREGDLS
jgi:RNA polymerase sigma-70 factor (ECF subfamily)